MRIISLRRKNISYKPGSQGMGVNFIKQFGNAPPQPLKWIFFRNRDYDIKHFSIFLADIQGFWDIFNFFPWQYSFLNLVTWNFYTPSPSPSPDLMSIFISNCDYNIKHFSTFLADNLRRLLDIFNFFPW